MTEAAVEAQRLEYTGIFGKEAADALIDQEYYCSFEAAILGAYWGKEMLLAEQQGRICDVPVNTDLPVHTAWDIGVDDAMAIWCFQVYPDHLDIVDYYEGHGQGFDHYCEWLDERGYHGTDWFPPDVKVREAGAPGARTRFETLVLLGRKPALVPDETLMDGINAGRKTIPFARFDKKRTADELRMSQGLPQQLGGDFGCSGALAVGRSAASARLAKPSAASRAIPSLFIVAPTTELSLLPRIRLCSGRAAASVTAVTGPRLRGPRGLFGRPRRIRSGSSSRPCGRIPSSREGCGLAQGRSG